MTSPPDDSISCLAFSPPTLPGNFLIGGSWANDVSGSGLICWQFGQDKVFAWLDFDCDHVSSNARSAAGRCRTMVRLSPKPNRCTQVQCWIHAGAMYVH